MAQTQSLTDSVDSVLDGDGDTLVVQCQCQVQARVVATSCSAHRAVMAATAAHTPVEKGCRYKLAAEPEDEDRR